MSANTLFFLSPQAFKERISLMAELRTQIRNIDAEIDIVLKEREQRQINLEMR